MQLPKRRSETRRKYAGAESDYLTSAAIRRLKDTLQNLEQRERPAAVEDVSRALQMGDLSENAAYSEAKGRLARIDGRIFSIKERLKRAIVIEPGPDATGKIRIGSMVVLRIGNAERAYQILGSLETDPARGRISHLSPLGSALLGHAAGESIAVQAGGKETVYYIVEVK